MGGKGGKDRWEKVSEGQGRPVRPLSLTKEELGERAGLKG